MENERDIKKIIEKVRQKFPNVLIHQLKVTHPADNNGIWYFWLPENTDDDIQIENSYGQCPFLIETMRDVERGIGNTIDEVVNIVCQHLETSLELKK